MNERETKKTANPFYLPSTRHHFYRNSKAKYKVFRQFSPRHRFYFYVQLDRELFYGTLHRVGQKSLPTKTNLPIFSLLQIFKMQRRKLITLELEFNLNLEKLLAHPVESTKVYIFHKIPREVHKTARSN